MILSAMFFNMTLLSLLMVASLIPIRRVKLYRQAVMLINGRSSMRLSFRILLCLTLLLFCAVNVSDVVVCVPVLSASAGWLFLSESITDSVFVKIRKYRRYSPVIYFAACLLMAVNPGEALCLLLLVCLLETSARYYMDSSSLNNRF